MRELTKAGISVALPDGWEGRISDRAPAAAAARSGSSLPLVQLASFALPANVADYGGGAVEVMTNRDLLIVVMEFGRESATQPLFAAQGVPRIGPNDVSASQLQRTLEGQGGVQRFFNENGRAFCLYVVFGSFLRRSRTVPIVNGVLDSVKIL
jgi:hypothetical protein